jgi:hypothetical protein
MAFRLLSDGPMTATCPVAQPWEDDEDSGSVIVVGATITDPEVLAQLNVAVGETAVRTPRAALTQGVGRMQPRPR